MNKIILTGNLTKDPEIRYTNNGACYVKMGIAVNRPFSKEKEVDFFNLTAWQKTAEFCGRYLQKGSRVLVEGRLQISTYEKNGEKRFSTDVIIENIEFAGGKSKTKSDEPKGEWDGESVSDDDMPF